MTTIAQIAKDFKDEEFTLEDAQASLVSVLTTLIQAREFVATKSFDDYAKELAAAYG